MPRHSEWSAHWQSHGRVCSGCLSGGLEDQMIQLLRRCDFDPAHSPVKMALSGPYWSIRDVQLDWWSDSRHPRSLAKERESFLSHSGYSAPTNIPANSSIRQLIVNEHPCKWKCCDHGQCCVKLTLQRKFSNIWNISSSSIISLKRPYTEHSRSFNLLTRMLQLYLHVYVRQYVGVSRVHLAVNWECVCVA